MSKTLRLSGIGIGFFLAAGLIILMPAAIADSTGCFYTANADYSRSDYPAAIEGYSSILDSGLESGNLYYNLGNSYFKNGELGRAILNYEQARRFIPRDRDLKSNYNYVLSKVEGGRIPAKERRPVNIFHGLFSQFNVNELTFALSLIYFMVLVAIIAGLLVKPRGKFVVPSLVILVIVFGLIFTAVSEKICRVGKEAVFVSGQAEVKFEPFDRATTHFTAHAGVKVDVLDARGDWLRVRRPDGKSGWVNAKNLEVF